MLTAQDRKDAQDLSRALRQFTAVETIRVNEAGAEVAIDGQVVGKSPLEAPVTLDIGSRRVQVSKDGFRTWDQPVPVGGSASTTLDVLLSAYCGGHTLDQAGLYVVRPRLDTRRASGESVGIRSFDGVVVAATPTVVRLHRGNAVPALRRPRLEPPPPK